MGERRSDLDDRPAVARAHVAQCGERAVNEAQIVDLHHSPVVLGCDLPRVGEHRRHRVVDPHVDLAELGLDPSGCRVHGLWVADVAGDRKRPPAGAADLECRGRQLVRAAGEQRDPVAATPERDRARASDSGRRTGDDDDLAHDAVGATRRASAANWQVHAARSVREPRGMHGGVTGG